MIDLCALLTLVSWDNLIIVLIISNMSSSLYNGEIEISDLLRFNPHQELIDNFIYEQKVFYTLLPDTLDPNRKLYALPLVRFSGLSLDLKK